MKVLMFGWEFPPHISGGLGTACYGLTKGLSGFDDVEVVFVVPKAWGDEEKSFITLLGSNEIPVIHKQITFENPAAKVAYYELTSKLIPYLGTEEFYHLKTNISQVESKLVESTPDGKIMFTGEYGKSLMQEITDYAFVATQIAREFDFDVIHVHDWMTLPAGIAVKNISGKPLVVHIHSTEFDRSGIYINSGVFGIEKDGMEAADQVIAVSNLTRDIVISKYGINPEKVTTVYNAVEPVWYEDKSNTKNDGDEKVVSFLGRITQQKGPEFFIETASLVLNRMENVRFIMAGKGDLLHSMKKLAVERNIDSKIDFPGFLNDDEVKELFIKSDVFIMPSVSEPFGIVALEAMQAGVPIIISRQSGSSEILKNVIKTDYWNIDAMADILCKLLCQPMLLTRYSTLGKIEAGNIVWKNSAAKIRKIYQELILRNPS